MKMKSPSLTPAASGQLPISIDRSVIVSASASCFVACPGCYNYFGTVGVTTHQLLSFVGELRALGLSKITVGGGDPLARSDIIRLLQGLADLGLSVRLDTVGTPFIRAAKLTFMGSGVVTRIDATSVVPLVSRIGIALDGASDATAQLFRRFASVADQQAILTLLDQSSAKVCINTVVHAGNLHELRELLYLMEGHPSVVEWQLFQFMPIGPLGFRNRGRYAISQNRFAAALESLFGCSTRIVINPKSAASRKHRYLLIDFDGLVWIPDQTANSDWEAHDANPTRLVLGHIDILRGSLLQAVLRGLPH